MYKVFINNKPLYFSQNKLDNVQNIAFTSYADVHESIDKLMKNEMAINIYHAQIKQIFQNLPQQIKTIYAAGGVVVNEKNELLMIHRFEKWDLPKGKIEKDESVEVAAVREVEEECGITQLDIVEKLPDTFHVYEHHQYILKITHWYRMNYHGFEDLVPQSEEGIDDVQWVPIKNLTVPLSNSYSNVIDLLGKHFSLSLSKAF